MSEHRQPLPLWPLPLAAGLLPAAASLVAWWLSTHLGMVPACNPFVDGCVSVSRAARHGLPNHLFRALVLPGAALQALTWIVAARWLAGRGVRGRGIGWIAPLGVIAAAALVLYGTFLGTEGTAYRMLRRYGTTAAFGFTCIAMLLFAAAVQRLAEAGRMPLGSIARRAGDTLAVALVLLGLANVFAGLWAVPALADRIENVAEWWASAILVAGYAAIARLWWRTGAHAILGP